MLVSGPPHIAKSIQTISPASARWGNRGAPVLNRPVSSSFFVTTIVSKASTPEAPSQNTISGTNLNIQFESYYRVMLHYSNWTQDDTKAITQRVKIGVPILTLRECEKAVKHAFTFGMSILCTVPKEKAFLYYETLSRFGLNASLEEA